MNTSLVAATNSTPGLVCAHHHLYSTLARGMPAPPRTPAEFIEILELVWWRLDRALDLEMLRWSAMLGALEALEVGCTAIIDHNESPNAIEGSLSVIADACAEVGVRVSCAYGLTDRHGDGPAGAMSDGARRGLAENERFLSAGGVGMVGLHAAFTCSDETIAAAADLAARRGVGVHVHVAEGRNDAGAADRLRQHTTDDWLLIHGVHLADDHGLRGTLVHNPRSNMNNGVGYARPGRFAGNPVALGTDGIGADMLDEFRLAYAKLRESDVTASPETFPGNGSRPAGTSSPQRATTRGVVVRAGRSVAAGVHHRRAPARSQLSTARRMRVWRDGVHLDVARLDVTRRESRAPAVRRREL